MAADGLTPTSWMMIGGGVLIVLVLAILLGGRKAPAVRSASSVTSASLRGAASQKPPLGANALVGANAPGGGGGLVPSAGGTPSGGTPSGGEAATAGSILSGSLAPTTTETGSAPKTRVPSGQLSSSLAPAPVGAVATASSRRRGRIRRLEKSVAHLRLLLAEAMQEIYVLKTRGITVHRSSSGNRAYARLAARLDATRARVAELRREVQKIGRLLSRRPVWPGWRVVAIAHHAAILIGPRGAVRMLRPGRRVMGVRVLAILDRKGEILTSAGIVRAGGG